MYDLKYTKIRKNQIFDAHDNSNFSKILHNMLSGEKLKYGK